MRPAATALPDQQALLLGLNSVFANNRHNHGLIISVRRRHHCRVSSFPSEILTCTFSDGQEMQLFSKYGKDHCQTNQGHWGGIAYEASIYQHILRPLPLSQAAYYGAYTDALNGKTLLVIEYLHKCMLLPKADDSMAALCAAARWIGQFHAANEAHLAHEALSFLNTYDRAYYLGWANRTAQFSGDLQTRFRWLAPLVKRFEEGVDRFFIAPQTVIHGEYTMNNIQMLNDVIYPVDWETAAIAMGEIDLVFLTDGWSVEITQACERVYRETRWPDGAPEGYEQRLSAARLYMQFLWLGCEPNITNRRNMRWRFKHLQAAGEQLGLI